MICMRIISAFLLVIILGCNDSGISTSNVDLTYCLSPGQNFRVSQETTFTHTSQIAYYWKMNNEDQWTSIEQCWPTSVLTSISSRSRNGSYRCLVKIGVGEYDSWWRPLDKLVYELSSHIQIRDEETQKPMRNIKNLIFDCRPL